MLKTSLGRETIKLFASNILLAELKDVLVRPAHARSLARIGLSAEQVFADYVRTIEVVTPVSTPRVVPGDTDDDHVVAAAVAAGTDLIVSGDRHLLALGAHGAIRIVTPAAALQLI